MSGEIDPAHLDIHRAAGHAQRLAGYLFSTGAYMIAGSPVAESSKQDAIRELQELCDAMGFALVPINSPITGMIRIDGRLTAAAYQKLVDDWRRGQDPERLYDIATEPNGDIAGRG